MISAAAINQPRRDGELRSVASASATRRLSSGWLSARAAFASATWTPYLMVPVSLTQMPNVEIRREICAAFSPIPFSSSKVLPIDRMGGDIASLLLAALSWMIESLPAE